MLPLQLSPKCLRYPRRQADPGPALGQPEIQGRAPRARPPGFSRRERPLLAASHPPPRGSEEASRHTSEAKRRAGGGGLEGAEPEQRAAGKPRPRRRPQPQLPGTQCDPHTDSSRSLPLLSPSKRLLLYVLPTLPFTRKVLSTYALTPQKRVERGDLPLLALPVVLGLQSGEGSIKWAKGPHSHSTVPRRPAPFHSAWTPKLFSFSSSSKERGVTRVRIWVPRDVAAPAPQLLWDTDTHICRPGKRDSIARRRTHSSPAPPETHRPQEPLSYARGRPHPQLRLSARLRRFQKHTLTPYTRVPGDGQTRPRGTWTTSGLGISRETRAPQPLPPQQGARWDSESLRCALLPRRQSPAQDASLRGEREIGQH